MTVFKDRITETKWRFRVGYAINSGKSLLLKGETSRLLDAPTGWANEFFRKVREDPDWIAEVYATPHTLTVRFESMAGVHTAEADELMRVRIARIQSHLENFEASKRTEPANA